MVHDFKGSSIAYKMKLVLILLVAGFLLIETAPTCKFVGKQQTDVICKASNTDYTLVGGLVSENNRTTRITLRSCKIIDIDLGAFDYLPALEYLDLSRNKIRNLKLGVLDESQQLKLLNLSYNQLSGFPLGIFDQIPNLEILDLKSNKINELELGVFDQMPKLRQVDISSNELRGKDMSPYIFDKSTHIHSMDFSKNDMSGSEDILLDAFEELQFLNLDLCQLTEVPKFATKANLNTTKRLLLSRNKITRITDANIFSNLGNLEFLNLGYNFIEDIGNVFTPLKNIKIIILISNRLKQIPDNLFQNLPMLGNVDLSHNRIEYVPVNAFRGSPIRNLNLSSNKFTYLTDHFCLELKNSGGSLVKFYFNQNPWQCACLRDILNEVKKYGIAYNSDKYTGDVPVCVTDEFVCKRQLDANKYYMELFYNSMLST